MYRFGLKKCCKCIKKSQINLDGQFDWDLPQAGLEINFSRSVSGGVVVGFSEKNHNSAKLKLSLGLA